MASPVAAVRGNNVCRQMRNVAIQACYVVRKPLHRNHTPPGSDGLLPGLPWGGRPAQIKAGNMHLRIAYIQTTLVVCRSDRSFVQTHWFRNEAML
jgi:hypothetical protein